MKVKSKLADIDFQFGKFEVKRNHLVIHSHPDQTMQSKVYVSPDDIFSGLVRAFLFPARALPLPSTGPSLDPIPGV